MAKREDDGTVPLAKCNAEAVKNAQTLAAQRGSAAEVAKRAIDEAFISPLDKPRGGRVQKDLRARPQ